MAKNSLRRAFGATMFVLVAATSFAARAQDVVEHHQCNQFFDREGRLYDLLYCDASYASGYAQVSWLGCIVVLTGVNGQCPNGRVPGCQCATTTDSGENESAFSYVVGQGTKTPVNDDTTLAARLTCGCYEAGPE